MIFQNRPSSGQLGAPSYITQVAPLDERTVDEVRVAGHPADVGGAPVGVVVLEVEDPLVVVTVAVSR